MATLRLAITSSAGRSARNGSSAPRTAPPAPSISTRLPCQRHAEVALDVVDQADAVEVVDHDAAVGLELQRVDRAGDAGTFAPLGGQLEGLQLERRGDVQAAAAAIAKGMHGGGEAVERGSRSWCIRGPALSLSAKLAWISGDLLWAMGLPMTA